MISRSAAASTAGISIRAAPGAGATSQVAEPNCLNSGCLASQAGICDASGANRTGSFFAVIETFPVGDVEDMEWPGIAVKSSYGKRLRMTAHSLCTNVYKYYEEA